MNKDAKASKKREAKLKVKQVQSVLRRWDPIGVQPGECAPADEYDGYAPHIVSMVVHGCSQDELCEQLRKIRIEAMGLRENPGWDREIATEIIQRLRAGAS